jgi:hypothetical protein
VRWTLDSSEDILPVDGGGQLKAELVSAGQSGEQSLKRIETAGERASDGLKVSCYPFEGGLS